MAQATIGPATSSRQTGATCSTLSMERQASQSWQLQAPPRSKLRMAGAETMRAANNKPPRLSNGQRATGNGQ